MAQNFAPYQDVSPDVERSLSPPPKSPTKPTPKPILTNTGSFSALSPPTSPSYQNSTGPIHPADDDEAEAQESTLWGRRDDVDLFETSLGIRLDYEAALSYLLLPPLGGVVLLMFEHRSDYVRFHAWQSSLLFAAIFVIHVVFSWSAIISWILFAGDIILIAYLTFRAYKDAETLDRYMVPFFGPLANSILDDE